MKKLFFTLLILLFALPAYAQQCTEDTQLARLNSAVIGSVPASGGSACTTQHDGGIAYDSSINFQFANYSAFRFTPGGSYTLCAIDVDMVVGAGTPAGTFTVEIWSDNTNKPGAKVASSNTSDTYNVSIVSGGHAYYKLTKTGTGLNAAVSATAFWVVFHWSAPSWSDYLNVGKGAAYIVDYQQSSDDGVTWSGVNSNPCLWRSYE